MALSLSLSLGTFPFAKPSETLRERAKCNAEGRGSQCPITISPASVDPTKSSVSVAAPIEFAHDDLLFFPPSSLSSSGSSCSAPRRSLSLSLRNCVMISALMSASCRTLPPLLLFYRFFSFILVYIFPNVSVARFGARQNIEDSFFYFFA